MAYSYLLRDKAIRLRKRGYSINEIVERVKVAKSTISVWVRAVEFTETAKARLLGQIKKGQLVARESKKRKVRESMDRHYQGALSDVKKRKMSIETSKVICAMIYWCEGGKDHYGGVRFTNSDPNLIKTFLRLLRKSFPLDESKFRACIHLHGYHNPTTQLDFWSKITNIKKGQFIRSYQKPNTGKRIREGYQGCVSIYYHSNDLARQLLMFAKAFFAVYNI